MSKSQADHDHTAAEAEEAPEPAAAIPESTAHLLFVLEGLVAGLAGLATLVPGAHTFETRLVGVRAGLDALRAGRARTPRRQDKS